MRVSLEVGRGGINVTLRVYIVQHLLAVVTEREREKECEAKL